VLDTGGQRLRAGALRLGLSPGRMTLNLSLPGLAEPSTVRGPDGAAHTMPVSPGELTLPIGWLADATEGPVALATPDGQRIRALSGPLMLFDVTGSGFWLTGTAGERPVIVLTCEPELSARNWGARRARVELPAGWALICDVEPDELPDELRDRTPDDDTDSGPVTLAGGLRLDAGVWLIDHSPHLSGQLDEPAQVDATGPDGLRRQLGELLPEEPFALGAIAERVGTHIVEVAHQRFDVQIADRGLREGAGTLAHYPRHPHLAAAGAIDAETAAPYGPPHPAVCGAALDGAGDPGWRPPLIVRAQAPVHAIRRDGTVTPHTPGPRAALGHARPPSARQPVADPRRRRGRLAVRAVAKPPAGVGLARRAGRGQRRRPRPRRPLR
jgi:hypothetical protein